MSNPPPPLPGSDHARTTPGHLDRALALVRFLRAHCPWDAAQTPLSLVPHLLEETHEVVDAIHAGDAAALTGELGDLLLNLAFQVVLGEEGGHFDADAVTRSLEAKMERRHPQLYGLGPAQPWEVSKAQERAGVGSVLEGLASGLDPLTRAYRLQERVAGVGFDWADHRGALDKVHEELAEVREALDPPPPDRAREGAVGKGAIDDGAVEMGAVDESAIGKDAVDEDAVVEEVGDLLFAVVNLARLAGTHPVTALERANHKFHRRFVALEALARARGVEIGTATLAELDVLWDAVKADERGSRTAQ